MDPAMVLVAAARFCGVSGHDRRVLRSMQRVLQTVVDFAERTVASTGGIAERVGRTGGHSGVDVS